MARKRRKPSLAPVGQTGAVGVIEVANPFYQPGSPDQVPARIVAMRSLQDDPLGRLHARKQIDDAAFVAGRLWQELADESRIGVGSPDPGRDVVDGGKVPDVLTDRQMRAVKRLGQLDRALGPSHSALVREVLGDRAVLESTRMAGWLRRDLGFSNGEAIRHLGGMLRVALGVLSGEFGLAPRFPEGGLTEPAGRR